MDDDEEEEVEDRDEDADHDDDRQCDVYDSKFELWQENAN